MINTKGALSLGAIGLAFGVIVVAIPNVVENLDASQIVVIQSPVSGELSVHTEPGWVWQGFGSITKYPRRNEFSFQDPMCVRKGDVHSTTRGLPIRFYDGGNAILCGSISWMMPSDPKSILEIHRDFRSPEAFETQAIRRSMEAAAMFAGPTMGSFDSAAGRRNELLEILNDQTLNGIYKTVNKKVKITDVTGVEKETTIGEIVRDDKTGLPLRAQESYVAKYKVQMLPMTISGFSYEERVEKQIQEQQKATNEAVISIAAAKKADQLAITAEAEGRAKAATAEWEQKTISAKTIAEAQARVTIAEAQAKEAEMFKKAEILRGEGEAARKRLVMEADGQLEKKLAAMVEINGRYADAIAKAQPGAWSPVVQMGGDDKKGGNSATALMEMLSAKTAHDLAVEMGVKGGGQTRK